MGNVKCDLTPWLLMQNAFVPKNFRPDPFENTYIQTILHMDKKALMKIPILDDDTFLSRLTESDGNNTQGELHLN